MMTDSMMSATASLPWIPARWHEKCDQAWYSAPFLDRSDSCATLRDDYREGLQRSMLRTNPWLVGYGNSERAGLRLFCFPYAGGGAFIYRDWHRILPASIGVYAAQLPGRGDRLAEAPYLDLPALIEPLTEAIRSHLDKPFAFFGHSMGALIAFE